MQLAGWSTYAQYIVRGIILLGAVAFNEFQKNRKSKRKVKLSGDNKSDDQNQLSGATSAPAE
jgi:hypothetical protein